MEMIIVILIVGAASLYSVGAITKKLKRNSGYDCGCTCGPENKRCEIC